MRTTDPADAARIELRLPAIKLVWASLAAQADKEGWPAGRFLAALAEHEIAERSRRRLERHLAEARLPRGKTLDSFDFEAVPVIGKAQVMALAAGDAWLTTGANFTVVRPPGRQQEPTLQRRSASRSLKMAGACCSPAPPISSSGCKLRVASSLSKPPLPSSTNSTC